MICTFTKFLLFLTVMVAAAIAPVVHAAVEISVQSTLQTGEPPIDVAVSPDGRLTYVLTDTGKVMIYDTGGNLTDNITVGTHVDQIEIGPGGERLFAASRQNKTVEVIRLDFINDINSEGSFFKGPANAPVTIAVFSEFQ